MGSRTKPLRVVVAAGLLGCVLASAPASEATYPGRNGRIAFTTIWYSAESNDDYREIWSIRPDGSAPRRLARVAEDPAYRPDGHMIAFARPATFARPAGIFLMRSDGFAKRRLLTGPYEEPDWSPDGRQLAFTRTRKPLGVVTWRRGGQLRWLTSGSTPAWSPTGALIAFTREGQLYVARPDGSGVRRLAPGYAWDPEWSPDGRRVVFTRIDNTMRSIRADGTGLRRVAPTHAGNPVYSPNGRLISYSKSVPFMVVLTMRADGRG